MKFVMPSCLQLFGKSPHAKLSSLSTIVHRSQLTRFAAAFVDRELKCTVFTYWNNPPWGCFLRSFKRPEEWDSALKRRLSSTSGYSLPTHHQSGVEEMSTEESVGILCHANSCPGFRGVLKQRYSDFIVNEVDPLGNVIHLTNINAPVEVKASTAQVTGGEDNHPKIVDHAADIEAFKALAGESNTELLEKLLAQIVGGNSEAVSPVLLSPDSDKSHRAEIHNFFKTHLTFLVTDTVDGPTSKEKCIRLRYDNGKRTGGFRKRERDFGPKHSWDNKRQKPSNSVMNQPYDSRGADDWPSDRPKFLRFFLFKENKDTQDALTVISRMLHVQPKLFGFSGTKDKRAITTQQVTVFKQPAERLAALNERLFGIRIGNFSYVDKPLVLGQLSGNRFSVVLRGVVADSSETIKAAAEGLGQSGFINYFGLQRFGSGSVATHTVGAALLRGEWKAAANLILQPRDGEQREVSEAREYYKRTQDADGALHRMPRYLTAERALLVSLKRDASNYLQAINCIPRTMRLMYVHSYQSYLWNHAASHRTRSHGVEAVVEGDLVYTDEAEGSEPIAEVLKTRESESLTTSEEMETTEVLDEVVDADVTAGGPCKVKCVTADDILSGKYQIWDVLLPLPGCSTLYPANDTANIYEDLARKDLVDLHVCTHNVKEYAITHLSGGYRRLLQKPIDLEWKILKYSDVTKPLAKTDLDKLHCVSEAHLNSVETNTVQNGCLAPKSLDTLEVKSVPEPADSDQAMASSVLVVGNLGASHIDGTKASELILNDRPSSTKINQEEACKNVGEPADSAGVLISPSPLEGCSEGVHTAVRLSFTLPASCYATMAIRELLKMSTSVAFHKTLNNDPTK
ncbi:hypothetical protein BDL97_16G022100 [Sphagnum fallax]|nr:hypothetical protein BDL97_16G022100 [Sphagnum fallax]